MEGCRNIVMTIMENHTTYSHLIGVCLLVFALLVFSPVYCPADDGIESATSMKPDSLEDSMLIRALNYVYSDSFTAAYSCLDSIITVRHNFWPGYVVKAGIVYTEMTDNEEFERETYFKALIDTALTGLDKFLKKHPDDNWGLFFKGTAMGYLALWEGHHGSWVKAIFKGLDAGKVFSRTIKQDSLFYDGYLGLGTLNYWRSAKMGIFRTLPFIPDKRELGIKQIALAMDSARYSSNAAAMGLAWIYIDRKEYNKVIAITNKLIDKGFTGRQILWPRGIAEFKRGYAGGTIENFSLILDGLERLGGQNHFNIGLCEYYLGLGHTWKGNYETALSYFNSLLDLEVDNKVKKRLKKKYKAARKQKDKIKERIAARMKDPGQK